MIVGVLWFDDVVALAFAAVGYLISAGVAHPRATFDFWRRWPAYRRYLRSVRTAYGEPVDLGDSIELRERALAGDVRPFPVFVSSTFLDLETERDRLAKDVFPRLARACDGRGAVWAPIDLRWGITDLQKSAGEVTEICLRSVERSRPNAIGIVGARYGALLEDGLSLTHLELRRAADPDPRALSVFVMDRSRRGDDGARVDAMLKELRGAGVPVVDAVADVDRLVDLVGVELLRRLDEQVPDAGLANRTLREISAHRLHEEQYADRPALNHPVLADVEAQLAAGRMAILRGGPASGRSTLAAQWARARRLAHPGEIVVCRFVGLTESSSTWPQLARSIAAEVALRTGRHLLLPGDDLEVPMALMRFMQAVQETHQVALCVDGLDRLYTVANEPDLPARGMGWLPQATEHVNLSFVPMVGTDDLEATQERAHPWGDVVVPELSYEDRLGMAGSSLTRVDRSLPPQELARIVEHPNSGSPAFLSLLLAQLHQVGRHDDLPATVEALSASASIDELVERCVDRVRVGLDDRHARQLPTLLSLLCRSSLELTEAEIVAMASRVHDGFGQADLALLRQRLDALLEGASADVRIAPYLATCIRRLADVADHADAADRAWLDHFAGESRRMTPRSFAMLLELKATDEVARTLGDIASDPRGLAVVRSALGLGFADGLGVIAKDNHVRASDVVRAAAEALADHDHDARLGVAEACLDYRLLDEVDTIVAETPWEEVEGDARLSNWVLALVGRAALRGGSPMSLAEWQFVLDHGMATRSANVLLAMAGIGMSLAERGNRYWAGKYFARAQEVAFACGNTSGLAAAASNAMLAATTDGSPGLLDRMGGMLYTAFDLAVELGAGSADVELVMASLFRRSTIELRMGEPAAAVEGFEVLRSVAEPRDNQHYLRLADLGRAVVLAHLDQPEEGARLAATFGLSLDQAAEFLERELRMLIV